MDLKALIAKMDQIESKKILTEAEDRPDAKKKETTWTDKDGKKHPATQVQGHQSVKADKEADKEKKKDMDESIILQSAIAKALAEEFGYDLDERITINPDGTTSGGIAPAPAAIKNPYQGADAAKFAAMSPEDQAWLTKGGGVPNITDQFILARAPNKGAPTKRATGAVLASPTDPSSGAESDAMAAADQADADMGAAMRAMAAGGNSTSAATGVGNPGEEAAAQAAADGAATKPAEPVAEPVAEPAKGGINPTVLNRYKELLDKLEGAGKKPATAPAAKPAAKPATGAGTKQAETPATGKIPGVGTMGVNDPTTGMPSTPMAEENKLADDQILALIRGI